MCEILDANVIHQVFRSDRPPADAEFFKWLNAGRGSLVVGGKLLQELSKNGNFSQWLQQARLAGRVKSFNDAEVNDRTEKLKQEGLCRSNDEHVIALAQISKARLLYTNDKDLQQDFKDKKLIDRPRGKVYSTRCSKDFQATHQRLLGRKNLCGSGC